MEELQLDSCNRKEEGLTEKKNGSQQYRRWDDLDHDILVQILRRDFPRQFLISLSLVFRSWRCACLDVLFWNSNILDMPELFYSLEGYPIEHHNTEIEMMDMIESVFEGDLAHRTPRERWSYSIYHIKFPVVFEVSDRVLHYMATRTPDISYFSLTRPNRITDDRGFSEAISNWKEVSAVELVQLNDAYCCTNVIRLIGRNWRNILTLEIHAKDFKLVEDNAIAIAREFPKVRNLSFKDCFLFRSALIILFSECRELETVDIVQCVLIRQFPSFTRKLFSFVCNFQISHIC